MRNIIAFMLVVGCASTASAGGLNKLGRYLGLGWSDGYHAGEDQSTGGWTTVSPAAKPRATAPRQLEKEAEKSPASSRRAKPALPSQRLSQQPVYWYR